MKNYNYKTKCVKDRIKKLNNENKREQQISALQLRNVDDCLGY